MTRKGLLKFNPTHIEVAKKMVVFVLLLVTFFLGIKQIAPFDSVDEQMIANWIWKMHDDPFPVNQYPPLMLYLHFFLSLIYEQILLLLGFINNHLEFVKSGYGYHFMMEAGRILVALFATGMVYFVYRIGRKFYNDAVAMAALFILGFNQVVILHGHIFKTDIAASFLMTVSLYFMLKYYHHHRQRDFIYAGVVTGLALATKYNVFPLIFVLVILIFLVRKTVANQDWFRLFWILPLSTAGGFFIAAPNWLVHPLANLKLFFRVYNLDSGAVYHFGIGGKDNALQIFGKIAGNFIEYFGPLLVVLFVTGVIFSIYRKNSRDLLVITTFFLYVLLFIWTGFYADRFCIPLYTAFTLLACKAIFIDGSLLFTRWTRSWRMITYGLWCILIIYSGTLFTTNVKLFNQLKTQRKKDWVQTYRSAHYLKNDSRKTRVASQNQTPRSIGDIRLRKIFTTKPVGLKKRVPINFILANLKYYEVFKSGRESLKKRAVSLKDYHPFFLFQKKKFQPWDYDFVFLYKISTELQALAIKNGSMALPRLFCQGQHTSYLPFQSYQKNPLFLKMEVKFLNHWLYSHQPLHQLNVVLFKPPGQKSAGEILISVNGSQKEALIKNPFGFQQVEIGGFNKKSFYHDYVYQLEMKKKSRGDIYLVILPIFKENLQAISDVSAIVKPPLDEPIPPIFSNQSYPLWVKSVYQKTGVDLTLFKHLNSHISYNNEHDSLKDVIGDFFPLQQGFYNIEIEGRQIFENQTPGSINLRLTISSEKSSSKIVHTISGALPMVFPLEIKEKLVFIKIDILSLEQNNLLVKKIILRPDYRKNLAKQIKPFSN